MVFRRNESCFRIFEGIELDGTIDTKWVEVEVLLCDDLQDLVPFVQFKKRDVFLNCTNGNKSRKASHIFKKGKDQQ